MKNFLLGFTTGMLSLIVVGKIMEYFREKKEFLYEDGLEDEFDDEYEFLQDLKDVWEDDRK